MTDIRPFRIEIPQAEVDVAALRPAIRREKITAETACGALFPVELRHERACEAERELLGALAARLVEHRCQRSETTDGGGTEQQLANAPQLLLVAANDVDEDRVVAPRHSDRRARADDRHEIVISVDRDRGLPVR